MSRSKPFLAELGPLEQSFAQSGGRRHASRGRNGRPRRSLSEALEQDVGRELSPATVERDVSHTQTTVIAPRRADASPEFEDSSPAPLELLLDPDRSESDEDLDREPALASPTAAAAPFVMPPWLKAKRKARWQVFFVNSLAWLLTLAFTAAVIGGGAFVLARLGGG
jgi:hypothetical protein